MEDGSVKQDPAILAASLHDVTINSDGPTMAAGDGQHMTDVQSHNNISKNIVAPTLRVEELKDLESQGVLNSSEDEGASHGEHSDCDPAIKEEAEKPFEPPEDELAQRIIKQVEFLFGDANILKDKFLLKHVRRNKLGYVSLKLITSFKKIKAMTKDYRVVAYSLRQSEALEVNEEGNKVRRRAPLPEYDETTPSRTVVAVNLPVDNPTVANVSEIFSKYGEIALIRILKPSSSIPPDVKKFLNKHPELGNTTCAVVEFEKHEFAKTACEMMTNKDDWRSGTRVALLATQKKEKSEKADGKGDSPAQKKEKEFSSQDVRAEGKSDTETATSPKSAEEKKKRNRNKKKAKDAARSTSPHPSSGSELDTPESGAARPRTNSGNFMSRNSLSPKAESGNLLSPNTTPRTTPHNSPRSSPRSSPRNSPTNRRKHLHGLSPLAAEFSPGHSKKRDSLGAECSDGSQPSSPWVQRRMAKAAEAGLSASPGTSPRMGRRMEGVIRQPFGPDGTRGFAGRGKLLRVDKLRSETV